MLDNPGRSAQDFNAEIYRLKGMAEIEFARCAKDEAERLRVTPFELRRIVAKARAQGKRMIEFYSPTGPVFGCHSSNERGSLRLVRSHPT